MNPNPTLAMRALASWLLREEKGEFPPTLALQLQDQDVRYNGLGPLCYRLGITRYKRDFIENSLLSQIRSKIVSRILHRFSEENLHVCFLKGIAYADSIYEDPALRPMGDIDLLSPPEQFERAVQCLNSLGFQERQNKNYMFAPTHHAVTLDGNQTSIDLHRSMTQPGRNRIDIQGIWRRADLSNHKLNPLDEVVLHLAHMFRHELKVPLISYIDLMRLLKNLNESDILERCSEFRLKRGAKAALKMMRKLTQNQNVKCWPRPDIEEILSREPLPRHRQILSKASFLDGPTDLAGLALITLYERVWRWN